MESTTGARSGFGALAVRLGRARLLVFGVLLAGLFTMHTAGPAISGPAQAAAIVHAPLPGQTLAAYLGSVAPQEHTHHPVIAPAIAASAHRATSDHSHEHSLGCDLISMCLALLAGTAAALLAFGRIGAGGRPGGPAAPQRVWLTRRARAPARPPSLAVRSAVCRT